MTKCRFELCCACMHAKKKERTNTDIVIRAIPYIPELDLFVAIYESPSKMRRLKRE